ncbi:hypothetical protein [uncultured Microbacterium sp.]|uniref:hypothetical protein n=1 Tax=uncultured Microbacterium sp. TaxID=191216 RepID=UPI0025CE149B|nr:hypothetical protein [uncultured Microbacterium sp.]
MSGPDDRSDDPDEVTIWAGRLRSWPANPPAEVDAVPVEESPDDDTVLVAPETPDDETALSARRGAEDDTVLSSGGFAADDTVLSSREVAADDTVLSSREVAFDDTVRSPSAPSADRVVTPPPGGSDTRPEGGAVPPAPDGPLGEATARSSRAAPAAQVADDVETTAPRRASAGDLDEATRRRSSGDSGADPDTAAGTRRARRASVEATAEPETAVPGGQRDARSPVPLQRESYDPRRDTPVRVERRVETRPPRLEDAAAVRPRARRGAARVIVLAVIVGVVVVAAAVGAVLLLG